MLKGLMQDVPLMISSAIEYARVVHAKQPFITRTVEGPIQRSTYGEVAARASQLAHALDELGIKQSDRVATIAWKTQRHFEAFIH